MTSAGRTFCVMPKSTVHTSPRSGTTLRVLLGVERAEHVGGESSEVVLGKIVGHWNPLHYGAAKLNALGWGELLNLGEDVGNGLSHRASLTRASFTASARNSRGWFQAARPRSSGRLACS